MLFKDLQYNDVFTVGKDEKYKLKYIKISHNGEYGNTVFISNGNIIASQIPFELEVNKIGRANVTFNIE